MSIDELGAKINALFRRKALRVRWSSMFVRVALVLGGSLVAAIFGLFADEASSLLKPETWTRDQGFAMAGLALAFVGSVYGAITDTDSIDELRRAQEALSLAKDQRLEIIGVYNELLEKQKAIVRLRSLYGGHLSTRGAFERALSSSSHDDGDEEELVVRVVEDLAARQFRIALGFELSDLWTICVYRAEWSATEQCRTLRLVAHDRSIQCNKKNARVWREGVGVGGIALAKRNEVVVPDLENGAVGTTYTLDDLVMKPEDRSRYRSLFAVPVFVGGDDEPWGVAMATSNRAGHFGTEDVSGVQPEETVRSLAGLVALAVSVARATQTLRQAKHDRSSLDDARETDNDAEDSGKAGASDRN